MKTDLSTKLISLRAKDWTQRLSACWVSFYHKATPWVQELIIRRALPPLLLSVLSCHDKLPQQKHRKWEKAYSGSWVKGRGCHGRAVKAAGPGTAGYKAFTIRKRLGWWLCLASFLLFIQSRTHIHGMVPPKFSVGLPAPMNPIAIIPSRPPREAK